MINLRAEANTRTMRLLDDAQDTGYAGFVDMYGFFFDYPEQEAGGYRIYRDSEQRVRVDYGEGLSIDTGLKTLCAPRVRP